MTASAGIELEKVCFGIGDFRMHELNLRIGRGEYFVLTGPNGAGKSLLIKLIAGLHCPQAGRIRILGREVSALPPWKRQVGYVPQDGMLFPNRSVLANIEFGLEVRKAGRAARAEAVARVSRLLGIAHLLDRAPSGLSGGERQRVALARALAFEPAVLLLDEPVSAIDESSRDQLCRELRDIQRSLGVTVLHVSHNRKETELVADRIAVLRAGAVESETLADRSSQNGAAQTK
jgi:ABC-type sugar transport system ATPase subunit